MVLRNRGLTMDWKRLITLILVEVFAFVVVITIFGKVLGPSLVSILMLLLALAIVFNIRSSRKHPV